MCGGDARECQASENQHAYDAAFSRCYRTKAITRSMQSRSDDRYASALVASTRFHPERVKTKN